MKFLAAFLAFVLAGCAFSPSDDAISVEEVITNIHELDEKEVRVVGWLGRCGGYDCGLYETLADARVIEQGDHNTKAWSDAMSRRLSVGSANGFDNIAWFFEFQRVEIRGYVDSRCREPGVGCFDRASELEPVSIKKIL